MWTADCDRKGLENVMDGSLDIVLVACVDGGSVGVGFFKDTTNAGGVINVDVQVLVSVKGMTNDRQELQE